MASATSAAVARSAVCLYCQGGVRCASTLGIKEVVRDLAAELMTRLGGGQRVQRAAERGQQHEAQYAETRQREDVRCRGQPRREQHAGEYGGVERE